MATSSSSSSSEDEVDFAAMENEVLASAQRDLDLKRVTQALLDVSSPSSSASSSSASSQQQQQQQQRMDPAKTSLLAARWQVAVASGLSTASLAYVVTNSSLFLAIVAFVGVFLVANQDPLDEDEDVLAGPLARLLGRATIQSVESSKPKLRAMARAALTNPEGEAENQNENQKQGIGDNQQQQQQLLLISQLRQQISELEEENIELARWKERRIAVDENKKDYTLDQVRNMAWEHNLPITGTKADLLMRLVEKGILR